MSTNVFSPARFLTLFGSDTRNVSRDPTLLFAITFSFAPAIVVYFWGDALNAAAESALGLSNIIFYTMPVVISLPAFLIGWVSGFLFLEDRDDGPLLALEVTPVGKQGFIAYRSGVTMSLTFVLTFVACQFILPDYSAVMHAFLSLLVALEALAAAFVLPAVARNKVEGLALTKLTNLAGVIPLVALIPSPLRYIAGIIPPYWLGELMGLAGTPTELPMAVIIAIALATHVGLAVLLYRMLANKVG